MTQLAARTMLTLLIAASDAQATETAIITFCSERCDGLTAPFSSDALASRSRRRCWRSDIYKPPVLRMRAYNKILLVVLALGRTMPWCAAK
jgi:hypothetical protein